MATLDDKLLDEKLHYYCSSSEDEKEGDDDEIGEESPFVTQNDPAPVSKWNGSSCNTGPKGVMKDYQRFKQLQREQKEDEKEELSLLSKQFSLTCRTNVIHQL